MSSLTTDRRAKHAQRLCISDRSVAPDPGRQTAVFRQLTLTGLRPWATRTARQHVESRNLAISVVITYPSYIVSIADKYMSATLVYICP